MRPLPPNQLLLAKERRDVDVVVGDLQGGALTIVDAGVAVGTAGAVATRA
jgi:hypothetical protein